MTTSRRSFFGFLSALAGVAVTQPLAVETVATKTYVDENGNLAVENISTAEVYINPREVQQELNRRRSLSLGENSQWTVEEIKALKARGPRQPIVFNRIKMS
jgi:cell division protein FtsI/penicillin-binding protein 2